MIFEAALDTDEIITDTRQHAFPVAIATKYSIAIALWLQHLAYWTENNLSLNKNIHDGLCWSYTTLEALGDKFPYMTKSQRETMINNSISYGLVVKGNYNTNKYDRTIWYALTPKAYAYFGHLLDEKYLKRLYLSISEKSEMDFLKFGNRFPKNRTPIPNTETYTETNNNISVSDETPDFCYNDFDKQSESSGLRDNQTFATSEDKKVLKGKEESVKSDYCDTQTNSCTKRQKKQLFALNDILSDNIFQIPEEIILDWIENRKKKRAAITKTAWKHVNKQLTLAKEAGVDPLEFFETMVGKSWDLNLDYFLPKETIAKKEAAKKRSLELEKFAAQQKQKEIEDSKKLNRTISKASEEERSKLRKMIGINNPRH